MTFKHSYSHTLGNYSIAVRACYSKLIRKKIENHQWNPDSFGQNEREVSHSSHFPIIFIAEVEGFEPPLAVLETAVLALRRHLYIRLRFRLFEKLVLSEPTGQL